MIIEIPDDNSIVRWKKNDKDEWKSAEISDLIKAHKETPRPLTAVDIINKAKDIKAYCNKRGTCRDCPLFVQDGMVVDCVFKCAPGDWEV